MEVERKHSFREVFYLFPAHNIRLTTYTKNKSTIGNNVEFRSRDNSKILHSVPFAAISALEDHENTCIHTQAGMHICVPHVQTNRNIVHRYARLSTYIYNIVRACPLRKIREPVPVLVPGGNFTLGTAIHIFPCSFSSARVHSACFEVRITITITRESQE
jgi:hypothetical protein